MKLSSKPTSSPCGPEKYPPQLMRFLRSKSASRSRGRSRSSPMFVKRKNAANEIQEPSSPKVTCMGQVRVKQTRSKSGPPGNGRFKWIADALFCHSFTGKVKVKPLVTPQEKWGRFFFGSCIKPNAREDLSKIEGNEEEAKIFTSSSCSSPPKIALSLTHCRSAPYRSSSLAYRFWEAPLASHGTNQETEIENRVSKEEKPESEKESMSENSNHGTQMDSETEENPDFCKKIEEKNGNNEESKTEEMGNVRPLILTRCVNQNRQEQLRCPTPSSNEFLEEENVGRSSSSTESQNALRLLLNLKMLKYLTVTNKNPNSPISPGRSSN
ncbi:uncharacterized protein LOC120180952 [Hibiscus syriacus]|uniref:uncharacterized protein LOC120180952 n=1 Tax=Hibiscus syriacus TaxID=106335 RepID=UPI0019210FE8|nr:uncharacterized protein LOC120180952 [Hibiscus syriacus]